MERIGVRELRQNASKYLERVKRGESIEVTDRGVPVAVLGPVPVVKKTRVEELIEQGLMTPGVGDYREWLAANPPEPMHPDYDGPSIAEILDEQREERL
jgi:prevent-host-death family protein